MAAKTPKLEIYQSPADAKWYWRLKQTNGRIIATAGEGYSARNKATSGAQSLKKAADSAEVVFL